MGLIKFFEDEYFNPNYIMRIKFEKPEEKTTRVKFFLNNDVNERVIPNGQVNKLKEFFDRGSAIAITT